MACWICTETLLSCAIDLDIYLGFAVSLLFLSICFGALLARTDRSYSLVAPGKGSWAALAQPQRDPPRVGSDLQGEAHSWSLVQYSTVPAKKFIFFLSGSIFCCGDP